VYVYDFAAEKESAVTTGGTQVKTHGLAEFVAQEEMGRHSGYWWKPDSKSIAYTEADHTGVEQWFIADPLKPDAPPTPQYYPRPGKKNVSVRLGVKPIAGGETMWVEWHNALGEFEYIAAVQWDEHAFLALTQDRRQHWLFLLSIEPKTGKSQILHGEHGTVGQFGVGEGVRNVWVNLDPQSPPRFSEKLGGLVWLGFGFDDLRDKGGPQIQLRSHSSGKLLTVLVPTARYPREVLAVYSPGTETFIMYAGGPDPTQLNVYRHRAHGSTEKPDCNEDHLLSPPNGQSSASFGKNGEAYTITSTNLSTMPTSTVFKEDGGKLGMLPSVAIEPPFKPNVTVEQVGGFWTAIVRPRDFDPKKKYPVVVDVYGGPKHLHVVQAMRNWLVPQWLADQGFIVVAIDNRGTPGRGRDWEKAIYQKFGTVPIEDQVKGLNALCDKFPELDRDRVGIVGWSFGGYNAANGVLRRPDVFKAAVAGAPVTDWEDYDTHYTERYLGLLPESQKAYDDANLIPLAKDLKRPLLLVHGTADDNVYYRHTLKLADALFRAGKDFEMLPLPGITHMYSADPVVMERLWARTAGFFKTHLGAPK
jgi:dipeptidyl-peptidase-4